MIEIVLKESGYRELWELLQIYWANPESYFDVVLYTVNRIFKNVMVNLQEVD